MRAFCRKALLNAWYLRSQASVASRIDLSGCTAVSSAIDGNDAARARHTPAQGRVVAFDRQAEPDADQTGIDQHPDQHIERFGFHQNMASFIVRHVSSRDCTTSSQAATRGSS